MHRLRDMYILGAYMPRKASDAAATVRIGRAAEVLGVSVATLRRWEDEGKLRSLRSIGGQRRVALSEVERLRRGRAPKRRSIVAQSARNRFEGVVTHVERNRVAAVVEVMSGPHRLVSLMTAEAAEDLGLEAGKEVVCVVKATNVIVEVPGRR